MAKDKVQRIIQASYELFLDGSFHSVGVDAICEKAGVNKGTLYYFFPSKSEILLATLESYTMEITSIFRDALRDIVTGEQAIVHTFTLSKQKNACYQEQKGLCLGCFIANISLEMSSSDTAVRAKTQWAMEEFTKVFEPHVARFLAESGITGSDTKKVSQKLMGLLQGAAVMAAVANDVSVFDDYAPLAKTIVLAAAKNDQAILQKDECPLRISEKQEDLRMGAVACRD